LKIFQILKNSNLSRSWKLEKLEFKKAGFHGSWTAAKKYLTGSWNCGIIKWENIFYKIK
jgi:hypothetical protein